MRITVHHANLQRAVGVVERVTAKNAALPILSNVLLSTERGRLRLCATNLEVGVTADIGAKVDTDGRIAVPGRLLSDLARVAGADTTTLTLKGNTLNVETGGYKTTILCFDAAEYPIIPKVEGGETYTVPTEHLRKILGGVVDSIAASESRPELAGAYLKFSSDKTTAAATDSFRLVECSSPVGHPTERGIIIPRGAAHEMVRILGSTEGDVTLRVAENQVALAGDGFELVSRLVDGRYPDYRKVIPDRHLSKALVRREDLEGAVRVAALFSSSISDVKLSCSEGALTVSAKNASKGEGEATVEANLKGEPFEISLNYHYLLDGMKAVPEEKLILQFTGKGSPFALRPSSEDPAVYVIMPLRG